MVKAKLLVLAVLALLLALTGPACGQGLTLPQASDRFAWTPPARPTANVASNVTMGLQIALDTVHSFKDEHRSRALWREGCRIAGAQGTSLLLKRYVHQLRPNGEDDNAFPSGHTATAAAAAGWRWSVGIPLTIGTAYFRIGSAKHDIWNTLEGAGIGLGVAAICNGAIK